MHNEKTVIAGERTHYTSDYRAFQICQCGRSHYHVKAGDPRDENKETEDQRINRQRALNFHLAARNEEY